VSPVSHGGEGDGEVWRDFAGRPGRLRAAAIRAAVADGVVLPPEDEDEDG